ncbi:MAG: hypothetical protein AMQ22_01350 [Candidatus Methanofastidiosum methylothiophilum]|uniref:Uncharacterized protein n=1 Tax=Candidatus Methanofastidiosum methylothiophilum TaxID=1705564 RepID=A0A150J2M1_9EURY|nr:MAG: hypothetical protein AMQ22_01350 [Candidatus Methanofastidiosum methylthiophilus]
MVGGVVLGAVADEVAQRGRVGHVLGPEHLEHRRLERVGQLVQVLLDAVILAVAAEADRADHRNHLDVVGRADLLRFLGLGDNPGVAVAADVQVAVTVVVGHDGPLRQPLLTADKKQSGRGQKDDTEP